MRLIDRFRIESCVQRYDFWLDFRGVSRSSRRELRRELRVNLADAAAVEGVTRALAGIGSPRTLAHAVAETSRTRPRWAVGAYCAMGLFIVLSLTWVFSVLGFVDGVRASGVTGQELTGTVFPWGGEVVAEVGADGSGLSVSGMFPPVILLISLVVLLLVAQPWRPLLRRHRGTRPATSAG